ncbi:hypothetical protein F4802DRAFT_594707 [Xylaria palmicola]|nr:hypothetical protein F4802DRAFT_594707 [Xylaria palmicola]
MDAWADVSTVDQHVAYLGQWTNWSRGTVLGATLTLTKRDGSLVIAFAAFFVTLVASRVWAIICLCCHQIYSSDKPQGVTYHQRQVILRNSPSPQSAIWKLLRLGWVSRTISTANARKTIVPFSLALICLAGFAGVTYVLPLLSSSAGDEILLRPGVCGVVHGTEVLSNLTEYHELVFPLYSNQITSAANYAQQCYAKSTGTLGCTGLLKDRIPSVVQFNATCPFDEDMCRTKTSNIFLDTGYINSHEHFGLNTPMGNRVLYRKTLQCAPLITEGYTTTKQSSAGNYTSYHHGFLVTGSLSNQSLLDGLYMIEDVKHQYRLGSIFEDDSYPKPSSDYQVEAFESQIFNGSLVGNSEYFPSAKLRRDDGDSYIVFLSGNGVFFIQPSPDAWYRASTLAGTLDSAVTDSEAEYFTFDEPASPLGCVQQIQICFEALPKGKQCGPLTSFYDAANRAFDESPSETATVHLRWVLNQVIGTSISQVLKVLGAHALTSRQSLVLSSQGPIAANQWQLDVVHWWATSLALTQSNFIDSIVGPSDRRLDKYVVPPDDLEICTSQVCEPPPT